MGGSCYNIMPLVVFESRNIGTLGYTRVDVIVTSRRNQTFDTEIFKLHGIDITKYGIVALKSSIHFRAGFRRLENAFEPKILTCDATGLSSNNVSSFDHSKADRFANGLWPIDADATFRGNGSGGSL